MRLEDLEQEELDDQIGEENQSYGNQEEEEEAERLQAEETVLNNHLECVKQEAYLITVEGEIITKLENAMMNDEQYDMGGYLESAEEIARKKLAMYSELLNNISSFKKNFGEKDKAGVPVRVPRDLMQLSSGKK